MNSKTQAISLRVRWQGCVEWISIGEVSADLARSELRSTEVWDEHTREDEPLHYVSVVDTCVQDARNPTTWTLKLVYKSSDNTSALSCGNTQWGAATYVLDIKNRVVSKAVWLDEDGTRVVGRGTILSQDEHIDWDTELVARKKRKQQILRQALIGLEDACVITGERTSAVLQAAHIVPVSLGGNCAPENGILLRSDLHALFDTFQLLINPDDGSLSLQGEASSSPYYCDLIKTFPRMSELSRRRIADALASARYRARQIRQ